MWCAYANPLEVNSSCVCDFVFCCKSDIWFLFGIITWHWSGFFVHLLRICELVCVADGISRVELRYEQYCRLLVDSRKKLLERGSGRVSWSWFRVCGRPLYLGFQELYGFLFYCLGFTRCTIVKSAVELGIIMLFDFLSSRHRNTPVCLTRLLILC